MIRSLSTLDSFHECSNPVQKALLILEKSSKKRIIFLTNLSAVILNIG